jgi:hypothetical protein
MLEFCSQEIVQVDASVVTHPANGKVPIENPLASYHIPIIAPFLSSNLRYSAIHHRYDPSLTFSSSLQAVNPISPVTSWSLIRVRTSRDTSASVTQRLLAPLLVSPKLGRVLRRVVQEGLRIFSGIQKELENSQTPGVIRCLNSASRPLKIRRRAPGTGRIIE